MADSLSKLTTKELRAIARDRGLNVAWFMTRTGLLLRLGHGAVPAYQYAYMVPVILVTGIASLLVQGLLLPFKLTQKLLSAAFTSRNERMERKRAVEDAERRFWQRSKERETKFEKEERNDEVHADDSADDAHLVIVHECDAKVRFDACKLDAEMRCPQCKQGLFPEYFTKLLARLKSDENFAATTRERKGKNLKSWEFLITEKQTSCAYEYTEWLKREGERETGDRVSESPALVPNHAKVPKASQREPAQSLAGIEAEHTRSEAHGQTDSLMEPDRLIDGRFEAHHLADGGMGSVYVAFDRENKVNPSP